MLRTLQRWLGVRKPPAASKPAADTAVLVVRIPTAPAPAAADPLPLAAPEPSEATRPPRRAVEPPNSDAAPVAVAPSVAPARPKKTPSSPAVSVPPTVGEPLPLSALGAISPRLLRRLRRAGVQSCGQLLAAEPAELVQQLGMPSQTVGRLRRYQRAIGFSQRFTEMSPHEALILFAAHRRTVAGLAAENAGTLRRDLQRLLLSSLGQKLAAGLAAPELPRVRQWIVDAKAIQERKKHRLLATDRNSQLPRVAPTRKFTN